MQHIRVGSSRFVIWDTDSIPAPNYPLRHEFFAEQHLDRQNGFEEEGVPEEGPGTPWNMSYNKLGLQQRQSEANF